MSYRVDRFNGTFFVDVADGTIDTTSDLRLIGKNYPGYGEVQNENFLHLLENFANTTPPPKPILGQIWYDSSVKKLKFYDGAQFKIASGAFATNLAPSGLTPGDFWFDTSTNQLYTWNGQSYVLIGPDVPSELSASDIVSAVVKDNTGTNHIILKSVIKDKTVAIFSNTSFTLDSTLNPIENFSIIKKGITLVKTEDPRGITQDDYYFWGTASNSVLFAGYSPSDFVKTAELGNFNDAGFSVGDQRDLSVFVEDGDVPVIQNSLGGGNDQAKIVFRIKTGETLSDRRDVAVIQRYGVVPGLATAYDLGSTEMPWKQVHASEFRGPLTGNVTGNITGTHKGSLYDNSDTLRFDAGTGKFYGDFNGTFSGTFVGDTSGTSSNALTLDGYPASVEAVPNTIPVRTANAEIKATRFVGVIDKSDRIKIDDTAVDTDISYRSAKTTPAGNSVAARDAAGNLTAIIFNGTATAARYADLAEKYIPDQDYEVGTVVIIGGTEEITKSYDGCRALGVISSQPAYMMNSELEGGVYVALKGRVPVKVQGEVFKGDRLVGTHQGLARAASAHEYFNVFAIALSDSDGSNVIEAVIL